jgi:type 1 fimbria pilin
MRRRWTAALSIALVLAATSCAGPTASRQVADRFMELYYTRMSVADAAQLSSGAARTRLDAELRALQGVPPDLPSSEPRVTFRLTASAMPGPTQASYTYTVTAHTADVEPVVATLTVTDDGGRWLVTEFNEQSKSPG